MHFSSRRTEFEGIVGQPNVQETGGKYIWRPGKKAGLKMVIWERCTQKWQVHPWMYLQKVWAIGQESEDGSVGQHQHLNKQQEEVSIFKGRELLFGLSL